MVYYNEIEPYCVEWLKALIAAALIPAGHVDCRPIQEVQPEDLGEFTQCHFFAGLGGWAYATQLAGWPSGRELWTGSCPCQPFSSAGRQQGFDDPRHLWPDFFRLIRACRPAVVMGEQTSAAAGYAWLDRVVADLDSEDYASGACDIPACSVNAPHIRNRLYWVADRHNAERRTNKSRGHIHDWTPTGWHESDRDAEGSSGGDGGLGDAGCVGDERGLRSDQASGAAGPITGETSQRERGGSNAGISGSGNSGLDDSEYRGRERRESEREWPAAAMPSGEECIRLDNSASTRFSEAESRESGPLRNRARRGESERRSRVAGRLEHADQPCESHGRLQRGGELGGVSGDTRAGISERLGNANGRGLEIGAQFDSTSQEDPADRNTRGRDTNGSGFWDNYELIGPDPKGKYRRVKSGLRLLDHGILRRVAKLRAFGNAIVPWQAAQVIGAFMEANIA